MQEHVAYWDKHLREGTAFVFGSKRGFRYEILPMPGAKL
jgi:hypothetical protein